MHEENMSQLTDLMVPLAIISENEKSKAAQKGRV